MSQPASAATMKNQGTPPMNHPVPAPLAFVPAAGSRRRRHASLRRSVSGLAVICALGLAGLPLAALAQDVTAPAGDGGEYGTYGAGGEGGTGAVTTGPYANSGGAGGIGPIPSANGGNGQGANNSGGAGGTVTVDDSTESFTVTPAIGGAGGGFGNGGNGGGGGGGLSAENNSSYGGGGGGGGGGTTVLGGNLTNSGAYTGGHGGYAGNGASGESGATGFSGAGGGGGAGLYVPSALTVTNQVGANITGGAGGNGAYGGDGAYGVGGGGGGGGAGLAGEGFTLVNKGAITGGYGGYGGTFATVGGQGGAGGNGIDGVNFTATNFNTIAGGNGEFGGEGYAGGGGGGVGGAGVNGNGFTVNNAAVITGGSGGGGGNGSFSFKGAVVGATADLAASPGAPGGAYSYNGGGGGGGGAGISGTGFTVTNAASGSISGGLGGTGGNGGYQREVLVRSDALESSPALTYSGGAGGAGGAGITGSDFTVINAGTINGADGGDGGYSGGMPVPSSNAVIRPAIAQTGNGYGGAGGNGGAGISGSGFTVTNTGAIAGGNGGTGQPGYGGGGNGAPGIGGAGIVSTGGSSVTTSGSIAGGLGGDGTTQADAVDFSGGGNTLTLETGYSFIGNVVSTSGTTNGGDTLALGGSGSFNLAELANTAPTSFTGTPQFYGFANLAKTGGGTTILYGQGGNGGNFAVTDGTLEVGDASNPNTELFDNVAIGADGILRGHGSIIGSVTNAGDLAPGGTLGVLTINGNYVQSPGGTLSIEVTPSNAPGTGADQLLVGGKASLAGTLAVQVDQGSYSFPTTYDILNASGGVTGKFSTVAVTKAIATYFTTTVLYDPNAVLLQFSLFNPSIFGTGRIWVASNFAQDNAALSVLDSTSGPATDDATDHGYWLHGIGSFGSANGYNTNSKGFVIGKGFDASPDLVLGIGVSNVYTTTASGGSSVDGSSAGVDLYGIYTHGPLTASGSFAAAFTGAKIDRTMANTGVAGQASGTGSYVGAALHLQYALLSQGPYFLAPYGSVNYLHSQMGAISEHGAGMLDLSYGAMSTSFAEFGAGILGGYAMPVSYGQLTAWASIGGLGTVGNPHIGNTVSVGIYSAREYALGTPVGAITPAAGLVLTGKGPWSADTYWTGQYGSATTNNSFGVQGRYAW